MDGEPPVEEDFSLIPVLDRCVHKVCWGDYCVRCLPHGMSAVDVQTVKGSPACSTEPEADAYFLELESKTISIHRDHPESRKDSIRQ